MDTGDSGIIRAVGDIALLINDAVSSCLHAGKTEGWACPGQLQEVTGQGFFPSHSFLHGRQYRQLWQLVSVNLLNICEKKINVPPLLRLQFL